ncbi:MAG: hypothetical protein AAGG38_07645 [Planctomycetota bacterium]
MVVKWLGRIGLAATLWVGPVYAAGQSLTVEPTRQQVRTSRGWSQLEAERYMDAQSWFARAANARPERGDYKVGYALAVLGRGDIAHAGWAIERALVATPGDLQRLAIDEEVLQRMNRRLEDRAAAGGGRGAGGVSLANDVGLLSAVLAYVAGDVDAAERQLGGVEATGQRAAAVQQLEGLVATRRRALTPAIPTVEVPPAPRPGGGLVMPPEMTSPKVPSPDPTPPGGASAEAAAADTTASVAEPLEKSTATEMATGAGPEAVGSGRSTTAATSAPASERSMVENAGRAGTSTAAAVVGSGAAASAAGGAAAVVAGSDGGEAAEPDSAVEAEPVEVDFVQIRDRLEAMGSAMDRFSERLARKLQLGTDEEDDAEAEENNANSEDEATEPSAAAEAENGT